MTTHTTPKTAAFRSLLAKAEALHAEICTLDTAIRDRDAIRTRMADCGDEAEARKHLGDLMRAEETVTIKQVRDPRLQADLADLLTQAEAAHAESHAEVAAIARSAPKDALAAFLDMLRASQLDPEKRNVELANPTVAEAIRPCALAEQVNDHVGNAWLAGDFSKMKLGSKIVALRTYLSWLDKALVAYADVVAEDKRMVAACAAFLKVLAKG